MPDLPPEAESALRVALAKEPFARYGSASAFHGALATALDGGAALSLTVSAREAGVRPAAAAGARALGRAGAATDRARGRDRAAVGARATRRRTAPGSSSPSPARPAPASRRSSTAFLAQVRVRWPKSLVALGRASEHFAAAEPYAPFLDALGQLLRGPRARAGRGGARLASADLGGPPARARRRCPAARARSCSKGAAAATACRASSRRSSASSSRASRWCSRSRTCTGPTRPRSTCWASSRRGSPGWPAAGRRDLPAGGGRDRAPSAARPARASWRGAPALDRALARRRSARVEVAAYLARELGAPPPDDLVEFVFRRSDGNPLFLVNVLNHLLQSGAIERREGEVVFARALSSVERTLPEGIVAVIAPEGRAAGGGRPTAARGRERRGRGVHRRARRRARRAGRGRRRGAAARHRPAPPADRAGGRGRVPRRRALEPLPLRPLALPERLLRRRWRRSGASALHLRAGEELARRHAARPQAALVPPGGRTSRRGATSRARSRSTLAAAELAAWRNPKDARPAAREGARARRAAARVRLASHARRPPRPARPPRCRDRRVRRRRGALRPRRGGDLRGAAARARLARRAHHARPHPPRARRERARFRRLRARARARRRPRAGLGRPLLPVQEHRLLGGRRSPRTSAPRRATRISRTRSAGSRC